MKNRSLVITAVLLMLSVGNYYRIESACSIRAVQFLSIFAIGMLGGSLITQLIKRAREGR